MDTTWKLLVALAFAFAPVGTALAQDEDDEESDEEDEIDIDKALEELLGEPPKEETVEEETRAVKRGDLDDKIGTTDDEIKTPEEKAVEIEEDKTRRLIKTLQKKTFLKIGRYEASPYVGFVTNDVFINRYILGGSFTYHATEVFGIEASAAFSPDFGEGDWKPITDQLVNRNQVSPDISKIYTYVNVSFQYSPIYGKVAVMGKSIVNFDVFGVFGTGIVYTKDDLVALQAEQDPIAIKTANQMHPTTNVGGGIRVIFSPNIAARVEGRSMLYIETVNSTTLEMKGNMLLLGTFSFFFPGME